MWTPTTWPMTTTALVECPPRAFGRITSVTLHSSAAGASATRGGATSRDGAAVRPAKANSLTPRGASTAVWFIAPANERETRLATNSRVSSAKLALCVGPSDEHQNSGGALQTALKTE